MAAPLRRSAGTNSAPAFQGRGDSIRPLPEHCWQRGGNIFRPGWAGCLTGDNPVPSHAGHSTSATARFGLGLFMKPAHWNVKRYLFRHADGSPVAIIPLEDGAGPVSFCHATLSSLLSPQQLRAPTRFVTGLFYPFIFYPFGQLTARRQFAKFQAVCGEDDTAAAHQRPNVVSFARFQVACRSSRARRNFKPLSGVAFG
jgi:hypothetical protein